MDTKNACLESINSYLPNGEFIESNYVRGNKVVKKRKVHSLTGKITESLMLRAFKSVKKNRGAAGIDKVSIKMFEQNLEENLIALMKRLKNRTYVPYPLRRKYIPKGKNKLRPLGIPAVRDRVAQEVIRILIEPYFEPYFSDYSYGFRPNRSCHQAIEQIIYFHKNGYTIVLDADIEGFFDNIPHELIMKLVASEIADGNILSIINKFLKSGVLEEGVFTKTIKGTPQGGIISPLLANIVLDILDKELAAEGHAFVRYADDFIVLAKSKPEIEKAHSLVQKVVEGKLSLKLSQEKTKITSFKEGFDFLGFHLSQNYIRIRTKSMEKFKDKIRTLTTRSHNFSEMAIIKINEVIRGFANFYATGFSDVTKQFIILDRIIRRRFRCMKKKRISMKDNLRIPNRYFTRKGLLSLCSFIHDFKEHNLISPKTEQC